MIHYIRPERINGAMTKLVLFFRIITENTKIDQLHVIFAHLCTSVGDQKPNYQIVFCCFTVIAILKKKRQYGLFSSRLQKQQKQQQNNNKDFGNLVFGH